MLTNGPANLLMIPPKGILGNLGILNPPPLPVILGPVPGNLGPGPRPPRP